MHTDYSGSVIEFMNVAILVTKFRYKSVPENYILYIHNVIIIITHYCTMSCSYSYCYRSDNC